MIFSKEEKREYATFYLSLKKGRANKVACSFLCSGVFKISKEERTGRISGYKRTRGYRV
jgi:hypothetical protein